MTPVIPSELPDSAPLVGVRFNSAWLPLVLSALMAYERNYLYPVNPTELIDIMEQIERLIAVFTDAKPMTISGLPIGTIVPNVGYMNDPDDNSGMLPCDGATYNKTDYPELWEWMFNAQSWGAAWTVDSTTLNVPNLNNPKRFIRGATTEDGVISDTGLTDGADTHTLTVAQLPSHAHNAFFGFEAGGANIGVDTGEIANYTVASQILPTNTSGGGQPHNNIPASMRIPYYIAAR